MIGSIRRKGLKRFWQSSDPSGIAAERRDRIQRMLDLLDAATKPDDLGLPGFAFHELKGDRTGTFAVTVSGNWRLTFQWSADGPTSIDFEDYH